MDIEQMIEEMAKDIPVEMREIAYILSAGWCRKGKCTENKCAADDCDIMTQAREVYERFYRLKVPEGSVVLTKEEYMRLSSYISEERAREIFREETEKLKEAIRKKTAREILNEIGNLDGDGLPMRCYAWFQELAMVYDVEVE